MKYRALLLTLFLACFTSFVAADPPEQSGPFVIRSVELGAPVALFFGHGDPTNGLVAIYGVDIVGLCGGAPLEEILDFWDLQRIEERPTVEAVQDLLMGDDVQVQIWQPDDGFNCTNLLANVDDWLVASGTADVVQTDNDLFTFLNPDTKRSNAFGFMAHGIVYTPDGARLILNSHTRCRWDGVDVDSFRCHDKINLR